MVELDVQKAVVAGLGAVFEVLRHEVCRDGDEVAEVLEAELEGGRCVLAADDEGDGVGEEQLLHDPAASEPRAVQEVVDGGCVCAVGFWVGE